jgi:hypothetical protein
MDVCQLFNEIGLGAAKSWSGKNLQLYTAYPFADHLMHSLLVADGADKRDTVSL